MSMKIHPQVDALIKPIIYEMTRIDLAQQTNPLIGSKNEPEAIKEKKKECVHITYDGNEYRLRTEKTADGRLVCRACGHEINTKFDDAAVNLLKDATKVIDQLLLFGMLQLSVLSEQCQNTSSRVPAELQSASPAGSGLLAYEVFSDMIPHSGVLSYPNL